MTRPITPDSEESTYIIATRNKNGNLSYHFHFHENIKIEIKIATKEAPLYCPNYKTHYPDKTGNPVCPICNNPCMEANTDTPKIKDGVTLKQVLDMKYDAEFRIMEAINKEMREIRRETGVSVNSIDVNLADITMLGFKTKEFAIRDVNLQLDLEERTNEPLP